MGKRVWLKKPRDLCVDPARNGHPPGRKGAIITRRAAFFYTLYDQ
jgi:hypothetical protein